jgi:hypothetical protein
MAGMRIDLIGHASLLLRSGELKLLTDPWWAGPAYEEQWYPYPFPVPERYDLRALDALYISHGHEDHLHAKTLEALPKDATLVTPRSYDQDNVDYLRTMGFRRIVPLPSGDSMTLRRGASELKLTLYTYLGDSMLAVEADGQVALNLNDALHCARREVADAYCDLFQRRWPRIDYLFCGFGGASYFPNCFRVPGKDNDAVARRREELFLANLGRIAQRLRPRMVFPFASHFVLPDDHNWWISELRMGMPRPSEYLAEHFSAPGVEYFDLQPGDHVENGRVACTPQPACDPATVRREVLARHPPTPRLPVTGRAFSELVEQVRAHARVHAPRGDVDALIRLWDAPDHDIRLQLINGRVQVSPVARQLEPDVPLVIETRSAILRGAIEREYGRDLICIGYGAIVRLRSVELARATLHERAIECISRFPSWRSRLYRHPLMSLSYLARDPGGRLAVRSRLERRRPRAGLYALDDWAS